jgi:diguanylate cyclase (GGDEF)-like protein
MSSRDLFKRENEVIQESEDLLKNGGFSDETSASHYHVLLRHYRKLFSQFRHLVKISDIQQNDLTHLNQQLVRLSQLDPLTGVPNRRRFEEELNREWRRHQRQARPLSLVMIDIDQFKQYNDMYGHTSGDECLRKVAQTLAVAVNRPADFVARFGGEEFVCVLPQTDYEGACKVGQRLINMIRLLNIPHKASTVVDYVTISIGIATLVNPAFEHSIEDVISAADRCLYQAKDSGRNCLKSVIIE